ncbi:MAG: hypothetical protein J6S83_00825 [Lachnospiraceae bacterium]|nr:hypothetical protein [Lachnospiraceae bacterium]
MQKLFTERAHLMCANMCFGIVMSVDHPYDEALIRRSMDRLSAAHPFLKALLGYEKEQNAYYYRITDSPQTGLLLQGQEITGTDSAVVMDTYRQLTGRDWDLFEEGMLKIAAWKMGEKTCFLLVFHHLLADGRGALGLSEELAADYGSGIAPKPAPEKLISSKEDFPDDSRMPLISRILVSRANRTWAKEQQKVSYQAYHTFADAFLKKDEVSHSLSRILPEEMDEIRQKCHENRVTVNDYLLARMMIEDRTRKVIIALDLRDRLGFYQEGALGNYSTAFSIEVSQSQMKKAKDPYMLAREVHERVRKKMARPSDLYLVLQCYADLDPGLLDAAFISCRGNFPSEAGRFIGNMFFGFGAADGYSVTNLGKIDSSSISSAFFIPPASPAIRKTAGILTVNNVLTVCTSERE